MSARSPYPPVGNFTWPKPGVVTWKPPERNLYGDCTGRADCQVGTRCPVGWVATVNPAYGCECHCHDGKRARAAKL